MRSLNTSVSLDTLFALDTLHSSFALDTLIPLWPLWSILTIQTTRSGFALKTYTRVALNTLDACLALNAYPSVSSCTLGTRDTRGTLNTSVTLLAFYPG